jgi:sulfonate transport system ATP-binding protein
MAYALTFSRVTRTFDTPEPHTVLADLDLEVQAGEFVALVGRSGCGKSTLLRLAAGLDKPQGGRILAGGNPIEGPHPELGVVFQEPRLFPWLTVRENVLLGRRKPGGDRDALLAHYLDLVGLTHAGDLYTHQLSGGMAQRVAIARALINEPQVMLLDEPFSALDAFTKMALQDALAEIWEQSRTTAVLVTHDLDEAVYLSDRVAVMEANPGRIITKYEVPLARPRDRTTHGFGEARRELLSLFRPGRNEPAEWAI